MKMMIQNNNIILKNIDCFGELYHQLKSNDELEGRLGKLIKNKFNITVYDFLKNLVQVDTTHYEYKDVEIYFDENKTIIKKLI